MNLSLKKITFHDIKTQYSKEVEKEFLDKSKNSLFKLKPWLFMPEVQSEIEKFKHLVENICNYWWNNEIFNDYVNNDLNLQNRNKVRQWFPLEVYDELYYLTLLHDKVYWAISKDIFHLKSYWEIDFPD